MPLFIDSHQDLAFNMMIFKRDYRNSAWETRKTEAHTTIPAENGQALLGWPEYQQAQTAVVFGTLFILPAAQSKPHFIPAGYKTPAEAKVQYQTEVDLYHQLADENPEKFRVIHGREALTEVLNAWQASPAEYPVQTHPVGLVMLMEGAEGISEPKEMAYWWEQGVRLVGPVWNGGRFCGSGSQPGGFTAEGKELLEVMAELGMGLDLSHMGTEATLYALDHYEGPIVATHANAINLIPGFPTERHFTDETIQGLIQRDGVMGTMPVNMFLKADWKSGDDRTTVPLEKLISHIDYICQMAGNTRHAAIGTDFDGGFGFPDVPYEINTISDIQLVSTQLEQHGYQPADIDAIFYGNWVRMLERILPSHG
jgi:membrane dipeptidase